MTYREANTNDIQQMQIVRNSVKENILSNKEFVTLSDYHKYIDKEGKSWVCEMNNTIVGFGVVDLVKNNIWALFILPEFENRGIGKHLHNQMLDFYFTKTKKNVWLSTSPNTRAETFYRNASWQEIGIYDNGEIKFEMTFNIWKIKTDAFNTA